jgi:hypothetical protein
MRRLSFLAMMLSIGSLAFIGVFHQINKRVSRTWANSKEPVRQLRLADGAGIWGSERISIENYQFQYEPRTLHH